MPPENQARRHAHRHAFWQGHGGYSWTSEAWNFVFNVVLAALLLLFMAPVFLILSLVVLISDGWPIFYAGSRMGKNKHLFTMYKFRTLKRDAESIIGAQILEVHHRQGTTHGMFLRDTRLDELPQLYNVLRRDMDLVGPRPIRPVLYEALCKNIPGYDRRFAVNAGLIGYAQLFTPHSAPKRIRVLIDNALVKQKMRPFCGVNVLAFTGYIVIRTAIHRAFRGFKRSLFARFSEKREYERRILDQSAVWVSREGEGTPYEHVGFVKDINELAFLIIVANPLPEPLPAHFKLVRTLKVHRRTKVKTTRCRGALYRQWKTEGGEHAYVFNYTPDSPLMAYQIQQYFLQSSFA